MPDGSSRIEAYKHTFSTLQRERVFKKPSGNSSTVPILNEFVRPHIESFNALFDDSGLPYGDGDGRGLLSLAVQDLGEKVIFDGKANGQTGWGNRMTVRIGEATIMRPMLSEKDRRTTGRKVFPTEARERLTSYRGRMTVKLVYSVDTPGVPERTVLKDCGLVPIMVRHQSVRCNIRSMSSAELVKHHEEPEEFGGYFIINGNERLIRYLILPRRNHVVALTRPSFSNRGPSYTPYAVQIRCVRPDQTAVTNTMHYLSNGNAMFRFSWRKQEYVIPVMLVLKALVGASDKEVFEGLMMKDYENTFLSDRVELLFRSFKVFNLATGDQCLEYLGEKFRVVLGLPEDWTDQAVGAWLIQKQILVHLQSPRDKFSMLLFMLRKLYAIVSKTCAVDNPDSPQHQESFVTSVSGARNLCVQLDGRVIGWASFTLARTLATTLRVWKTEENHNIPLDLEVGLVPPSEGGQYPGLYLFSSRSRMMRPVKYVPNGRDDQVGSFEQVYMDIALKPEEIEPNVSTHVEHAPTNFLSILANMTPFSDFNQMGKQTMGTPSTALKHRTDNKLYRLQSGQTPIVRPALHNTYGMDSFPNGTNAIVAVISYTGYDMEDAMILNKSAHERGFAYGTVYKSQIVDLKDVRGASKSTTAPTLHFGLGRDIHTEPGDRQHPCCQFVDLDGLPFVGGQLSPGDPIAAYIDDTTGRTVMVKYKGDELAYIDEVRLLGDGFAGSDTGDTELQKIHITLRITRAPVIGDKFSSRHGQKGVCSQKYPAVDMPFSESGLQPDVIINPHAFPSRMTIGMLVESMAAKAGAMHGVSQDATPFSFSESDTAIDYFGKQLLAAGYNYYGNEPMYSGITGQEFAADIYFGVVYYQRLRHMVLDKFQVRTTGPVDPVTRQPVKGRKRAGGIRFGEMERDALIAHGASFLLQDRLMNCSDYSTAWVCRTCGSLISLGYDDVSLGEMVLSASRASRATAPGGEYCRVCRASAEGEDERRRKALATGQQSANVGQTDVRMAISERQIIGSQPKGADLDVVAVPYVFRYLCAELASMGIAVSLAVH
ncbi:hypothetical protein OF83DRAFT_1081733 [Amylostereum chailletii]|nr:hypothetical protein OF83DRAFT_1081733 [Amylostereum chailletii]